MLQFPLPPRRAARLLAQAVLRARGLEFDESKHARDEAGRFTDSGFSAQAKSGLAGIRRNGKQVYDPRKTMFILKDGTRIGAGKKDYAFHQELTEGGDELDAVLAETGAIRYNAYLGNVAIHVGGQITERQATMIEEDAEELHADFVHVDVAYGPPGDRHIWGGRVRAQGRSIRAFIADALLGRHEPRAAEFDPDQPRDEQGRWTSTGASHKENAKAWKNWDRQLTAQDRRVLDKYQSGRFTQSDLGETIQNKLRQGLLPPDAQRLSDALSKAIAPRDLTLYRGVSGNQRVTEDDYVERGFMSTSFSQEHASDLYANPDILESPQVLELKIPKGTKGVAYLDAQGGGKFSGGEGEVLINRWSEWRRTGTRTDSKGREVVTLELDRLRDLAFNPDQPRDERGRWSDGSTGTFDEGGSFKPHESPYAHHKIGSIDVDTGLVRNGMNQRLDRLNDLAGVTVISTDAGHPELAGGKLSVIDGTEYPGFNFRLDNALESRVREIESAVARGTDTKVSARHTRNGWVISVDSTIPNTGKNVAELRDWWDRAIGRLENAIGPRALAFNPDQPRDDKGQWTSDGGAWAAGAGVGDADVADASIAWAAEKYPRADVSARAPRGLEPAPRLYKGQVDGLVVRYSVPNTDSIGATFFDSAEYDVLPGIREVALDDFDENDSKRAADDQARADSLAAAIKESGEIAPLIVVVDGTRRPWVLEGSHRLPALKKLGKQKAPALVVVDHRAVAEPRTLAIEHRAAFDPDQPRDDAGRWTDAGGGESGSTRRVGDDPGEPDTRGLFKSKEKEPVDTAAHPIVRDGGLWGSSHGTSSAMSAHAAGMMGIEGYKSRITLNDSAAAHVENFLTRIAESPGVEEPVYHGFQNTRGIEFKPGDTFKLPLTATAGSASDAAGYGIRLDRADQAGEPTVFEFPKGTPVVAYSKWRGTDARDFGHTYSEALTAGEFRVVGTQRVQTNRGAHERRPELRNKGIDYHDTTTVNVVSLEPVATFHPQKGWQKR